MSGLSRPLPGSTSQLARPLFTLFSRTRGARWGAVLVFITAFGMMVLHVITQSLTLSGQQRADSALGVHEASTTALPGVPLGEAAPEEEIRELLSDYGAERIDVMLTISPLQGGGSAKEFSYTEVDLAGGAFPDRFSLIDGTWPTEPGQACVSPAGAEEVRPGTTLGFYFGAVPLTVSCVAHDRFAQDAVSLYAAPGGWAQAQGTIDREQAQRWNATATLTVLWSGGELLSAYEALVAQLGDGESPADVDFGDAGGPVLLRDSLLMNTRSFNAVSNPWLFLVPLAALPVISGFVSAWGGGRLLAGSVQTLYTLGLKRSRLRSVTVILPLVWTIVGTVAGVLAGVLLSSGIRWVMGRTSTTVLGPVVGTPVVVAIVVGGVVLGVLIGTVPQALRMTLSRSPEWGWLRLSRIVWPSRLLAVGLSLLAVSAAVALTPRGEVTESRLLSAAVLYGMAVVLLALVLVPMMGRSQKRPALHVASQQVLQASGSWVIVVIFGVQGLLATAGVTLSTSGVQSFNDSLVTTMPAGQARFRPVMDNPDDGRALTMEVAKDAALDSYFTVDMVLAGTHLGDGSVYVADNVSDAAVFAGVSQLSAASVDALTDGHVLRSRAVDGEDLLLVGESQEGGETVLGRLPVTVDDELDRSMDAVGGIILASAADQLELPPGDYPTVVFPNLTEDQLETLRSSPERLGYSDAWIQLPRPPDEFTVPPRVVSGAVIMTVLGVALALLCSLQVTAGSRPLVAGLRSMGLRRSWTRSLLFDHLSILILVPLVFGVLGGMIGVLAVALVGQVPLSLHVPWGLVALVLAGPILGFVVALLISHVRLSAAERLG